MSILQSKIAELDAALAKAMDRVRARASEGQVTSEDLAALQALIDRVNAIEAEAAPEPPADA